MHNLKNILFTSLLISSNLSFADTTTDFNYGITVESDRESVELSIFPTEDRPIVCDSVNISVVYESLQHMRPVSRRSFTIKDIFVPQKGYEEFYSVGSIGKDITLLLRQQDNQVFIRDSKVEGFYSCREASFVDYCKHTDFSEKNDELKTIDGMYNNIWGSDNDSRFLDKCHAIGRTYHSSARLKNRNIESLRPLSLFRDLEELDISHNPIKGLKGLDRFKRLEKLNMNNTKIQNIEPVSKLKRLRSLDMSNTEVTELSALEKLTELEILDISGLKLDRFEDLSKLVNLKQLTLRNMDVDSLEVLEKLPNLLCVDIRGAQVSATRSELRRFQAKYPECR